MTTTGDAAGAAAETAATLTTTIMSMSPSQTPSRGGLDMEPAPIVPATVIDRRLDPTILLIDPAVRATRAAVRG